MHKQPVRWIARRVLGAFFAMAAVVPGAGAADFYAGKQITVIASNTGSYEAFARILAKHMPRYIPGNPKMITQLMSGASGLQAANYTYNTAPRDGTVFTVTQGQVPFTPITNPNGARFDANKFSWIGSATKDTFIGYVWHSAKVQSLDDAKTTEALVGGQAVGSMSINMAILAKDMFGLKFKIITGYTGASETKLAVEKGEIDGHFGTDINSVKASNPNWFTEKKITIITQFGFQRDPEIPDVPLFIDLAKTQADRQLLEALLSGSELGKPFYGPPEIPADRLAVLRSAFDQTVKDPGFIGDLAREHFVVDQPMNGDAAAAIIKRVSATPPEVIQRMNDIFEKFRQEK
jgi:tripartite-type tricarboxylate transporter receptor subunit TctC